MLIRFTRTDGSLIFVNPDTVRVVTPYSSPNVSMIYFAKDHFAIVEGDEVTVADAISRPPQF